MPASYSDVISKKHQGIPLYLPTPPYFGHPKKSPLHT